ncbi:MAG: hypothetical protein QM581_00830 [Pseudomonas sp.]
MTLAMRDVLINNGRQARIDALNAVGHELATIVLAHGKGNKNALAWKIGQRLRQGYDAGELSGGMMLVLQHLQCTIEIEAKRRFSLADLGEFMNLYDLFPDDRELLERTSFGVASALVRALRNDPEQARRWLLESVEGKYSLSKLQALLGNGADTGPAG